MNLRGREDITGGASAKEQPGGEKDSNRREGGEERLGPGKKCGAEEVQCH